MVSRTGQVGEWPKGDRRGQPQDGVRFRRAHPASNPANAFGQDGQDGAGALYPDALRGRIAPFTWGFTREAKDMAAGSLLVHNVYFSLKDGSPAARERLLASCRTHLSGHAGTVLFAVGTASDLARPVNDRDFDVALHLVFQSRKAHDDYQVHERHQRFIAENKDNWSRVRVFDSDANC